MLYHASPIANLTELSPRVSNHGKPLVYLSEKRENVLVYLSNAVEKCCREEGFEHKGIFTKWGSYGFSSEGVLVLDEYYPNATYETYKGVEGYIYRVSESNATVDLEGVPFAKVSEGAVRVVSCEYIPDAYEAFKEAEAAGKIVLTRYEDNTSDKLEWIRRTVIEEYREAEHQPEYRFFLKRKFEHLFSGFEK